MASIEDLMTPAEKIESLEKNLTDSLDDLLVANKIEEPRKVRIEGGRPGYTGFMVVVKEKPRVNFRMDMYPNETEEPHFKVTYQGQTCRFRVADCTPDASDSLSTNYFVNQKMVLIILFRWDIIARLHSDF